jgi:hypothetical protein
MSIGAGHFHFSPSGLPDKADWIEATQLRLREWKILRGYTLPYCAGWDETERVVYVDELVPETFERHGRVLKVVEGSLFWHESIESDICRAYPDEHYQGGHTIATNVEWTDVKVHGFDIAWYDAQWDPIIKACSARKTFPRMPAGCSLLPYHDSGDDKLIERMTFVQVSK